MVRGLGPGPPALPPPPLNPALPTGAFTPPTRLNSTVGLLGIRKQTACIKGRHTSIHKQKIIILITIYNYYVCNVGD